MFKISSKYASGCSVKSVNNISLLIIDFSLTVKAATLIFIAGCGSAISSVKQGKSGSIYNLVELIRFLSRANMKILTVYTLNSHVFLSSTKLFEGS